MEPFPSGILTFMFTDIVRSTKLRDALIARHGEGEGNRVYRERILDPHNARVRGLLAKYEGFEVDTAGDSFLVAFAEPENAVLCAAAIQRSLRGEPIATEAGPLAVRIGMHTGVATLVERQGKPNYDGHAVNIASRVEHLLEGGERIYCSHETATLAKTAPDARFHSYGKYALKGVSGKVEIVEVLWDATVQPEPPKQPRENLPYPWLTQWVGREREMAELAEALSASRLVTLHGTGGVGKTRTAVETLLARGGGLPRDVVFVSLERADDTPEGLVVAVRDALGITEADAPDLIALCRWLQGGDRLLLLDNFESVMSAAAAVRRLATTPGVRVLVTTQQVLGVSGERVVELEPMETKGDLNALESYRLFVTLAQQRDARWQPDDEAAMREVLVATDGLPYLIELVAAVAPKRKLQQLAEDLKTRVQEVRARGAISDRHASVQACLEWALARLPEAEREALPRLAIFAGGFEAEAAAGVASTTIESLDVLVDASLLRFDRETWRYSMLPSTQQFLLGRLDGEERTRLAGEHARWFIQRLDRADLALRAKGGDTQMAARRWIDAEYDNVWHATAHAEEVTALFGRAVTAFVVYLEQTCRFLEDVCLQEALLRQLDRDSAPEQWAIAQNNLRNAYWGLRIGNRGENLTKALACYEAALQVWTEHDYPFQWAGVQNNLGLAHADMPAVDRDTHVATAIEYCKAALRVWTEDDFPVEWALTQHNLGKAYASLSAGDRSQNVAKAIECYEAALRVRTERDFPLDWAVTQHNLGSAYARLSNGACEENLTKAITYVKGALEVRNERDFPKDWADTNYSLGLVYSQLGKSPEDVQQAISCFESAARGYAAVGLDEDAGRVRHRAAQLAAAPPPPPPPQAGGAGRRRDSRRGRRRSA